MRSVDANAEFQFLAAIHDRPQMFEAMTDAFALAGSVLKQDANAIKPQSLRRNLQTTRARPDRIRFARATRAAGTNHNIIDAERNRPLHFFAKRCDRLL